MSDPIVTLSQQNGVGILTLNRPPANSYDMNFVRDLSAAVDQAAKDDAVKVVVVKSALEKFFSAGADIKFFSSNSFEANMEMINAEHESLEKIAGIPKIFIAMIGGHCLGGGLEIALACDLRFCGDGEFKLGLPEVTLGLLPGNGGTQRLPRLIGSSRALDLMSTGRTLSPREAVELGVINRVLPMAELEAKTLEYAASIASGASFAAGRIKQAVHQGMQLNIHDGLARERAIAQDVFKSADAKEGIAAFVEKRKPTYKGK
jgi:enoyl-CoA hydratase/carnithine racemase